MTENIVYRKTLNLGKIDFYGHGRKINAVEINIKLTEKENKGLVLSICGDIWNCKHTDIVSGGQIYKYLPKFFHSTKIKRLVEIWKRWHLNDLHAGCEHQREFEKEPYENHRGHHCDICNYTYGTGWQFEKIPDDIIEEIKSF